LPRKAVSPVTRQKTMLYTVSQQLLLAAVCFLLDQMVVPNKCKPTTTLAAKTARQGLRSFYIWHEREPPVYTGRGGTTGNCRSDEQLHTKLACSKQSSTQTQHSIRMNHEQRQGHSCMLHDSTLGMMITGGGHDSVLSSSMCLGGGKC